MRSIALLFALGCVIDGPLQLSADDGPGLRAAGRGDRVERELVDRYLKYDAIEAGAQASPDERVEKAFGSNESDIPYRPGPAPVLDAVTVRSPGDYELAAGSAVRLTELPSGASVKFVRGAFNNLRLIRLRDSAGLQDISKREVEFVLGEGSFRIVVESPGSEGSMAQYQFIGRKTPDAPVPATVLITTVLDQEVVVGQTVRLQAESAGEEEAQASGPVKQVSDRTVVLRKDQRTVREWEFETTGPGAVVIEIPVTENGTNRWRKHRLTIVPAE